MSFSGSYAKLSSQVRALNCLPITEEEYAHYYEELGGSFILHPKVLAFFRDEYGVKAEYHGYVQDGQYAGVAPSWGPFIAGERYALRAHKLTDRVDFGYPLLYLPIAESFRCSILFRARFLVELQRPQLSGAVYLKSKSMAILKQIPDALVTGKREFRMKERKFANLGGTIKDVQDFSNEEIVDTYRNLFRVRWNHNPHAWKTMAHTLATLRPFLWGKVLLLSGKPVAIQINYRAETRRTICIDYLNGGVDKTFNGISPGSLLSYINGKLACEEAKQKGKKLIYSYGKADAEYKDQWCDRIPRGYTGFWMP